MSHLLFSPVSYFFLSLGLFSFASMGVIHKLGDRMGAHPLSITLIAMSAGAALSFLYATCWQAGSMTSMPRSVVLLALPFGAFAALGLWFFQQALRHGHIATSWLMINLSAGIPTSLSMIFYHEPLTGRKLLVFLLVLSALLLLWWDRRGQVPGRR